MPQNHLPAFATEDGSGFDIRPVAVPVKAFAPQSEFKKIVNPHSTCHRAGDGRPSGPSAEALHIRTIMDRPDESQLGREASPRLARGLTG